MMSMVTDALIAGTWFLLVTFSDAVVDAEGPHLFTYGSRAQCEDAQVRLRANEDVLWVGACDLIGPEGLR